MRGTAWIHNEESSRPSKTEDSDGPVSIVNPPLRLAPKPVRTHTVRFFAYFTTGTPYEQEAAELVKCLEQWELNYDVIPVPSLGSWQRNTQLKSKVVQKYLKDHPHQPAVYVDVDAKILQRPTLFNTLTCDIAATRFGGRELLSGTVYFGGTAKTVEVVDRWVGLCEQYPENFPAGLLPDFKHGGPAWDQRMVTVYRRALFSQRKFW